MGLGWSRGTSGVTGACGEGVGELRAATPELDVEAGCEHHEIINHHVSEPVSRVFEGVSVVCRVQTTLPNFGETAVYMQCVHGNS